MLDKSGCAARRFPQLQAGYVGSYPTAPTPAIVTGVGLELCVRVTAPKPGSGSVFFTYLTGQTTDNGHPLGGVRVCPYGGVRVVRGSCPWIDLRFQRFHVRMSVVCPLSTLSAHFVRSRPGVLSRVNYMIRRRCVAGVRWPSLGVISSTIFDLIRSATARLVALRSVSVGLSP